MPKEKWELKTGKVIDRRDGKEYRYDAVTYASNVIVGYRIILEDGKKGRLSATNVM